MSELDRALRALRLEVDASIADDVARIVYAAVDRAKYDAWEEASEAVSEWMWSNPTPSGTPLDPPKNPYELKHEQRHRPQDGASECTCGKWVGPMTKIPSDDPRSFMTHLKECNG